MINRPFYGFAAECGSLVIEVFGSVPARIARCPNPHIASMAPSFGYDVSVDSPILIREEPQQNHPIPATCSGWGGSG